MHTIYQYMATVKKITRTVNYLPPMKSLHDWFNYAFKSSELDEVNRFPRSGYLLIFFQFAFSLSRISVH